MVGLPREGDRYDRFLLRRQLGRGGTGAVFEAYDPEVRDLVALHVRDASERGGTLYLVTDLAPGHDLRTLLAARGPLPAAEALRLVADLSEGLAPLPGSRPAEVLVWEHEGALVGYLAGDADVPWLGQVLWACLSGEPDAEPPTPLPPLPVVAGPTAAELEVLLARMLSEEPPEPPDVAREARLLAGQLEQEGARRAVPEETVVRVGTAPPRSSRGTDLRRTAAMVALVLVSLVAIAVGGVAVARMGSGDADRTDAAAAEPTTEAPPSPTAEAPPPPPPPPPPAPAFTCWNGPVVAAPEQCPTPSGVEGFFWVFPGLQGENCALKPEDSTPGRLGLMECRFRGEGAVVLVSFWKSTQVAVAYFSDRQRLGQPVVSPAAVGQEFSWVGAVGQPGYPFRAARLYSSYNFGWSVKTRDENLRTRLLTNQLLLPRPAEQYLGTPVTG